VLNKGTGSSQLFSLFFFFFRKKTKYYFPGVIHGYSAEPKEKFILTHFKTLGNVKITHCLPASIPPPPPPCCCRGAGAGGGGALLAGGGADLLGGGADDLLPIFKYSFDSRL